MSKSKSLPEHVLHVSRYEELETYAKAFASGHLNLLIVCGPPGVGKSRSIHEAIGETAHWVDGNASAFGIYLSAYEFRNKPIVLDDVDGLYRDKNGVRLLKALCQTDRTKAVSWLSDAKTLDRQGVPRRFETSSRVAIIANQWRSVNADVAALEDRGHLVVFEPEAPEVHRCASKWFWDQEVFDFVAAHLHLTFQHSLRTYVLATELKEAGLDWRLGILSRCLTGTRLEVARLKAEPSYLTEEARVRAFVAGGFGCRATYFNHARKPIARADTPSILLTRQRPPETADSPNHVADELLIDAAESKPVRLLDC